MRSIPKIAQCSLGPAPLCGTLNTKTGAGLDTVEDDTGPSRTGPAFLCCVVCAGEHDVYFEISHLRSSLMSAC